MWDSVTEIMYYPEDFKLVIDHGEPELHLQRKLGVVVAKENDIGKSAYLMQSTGFKDSCGTEMYEGDIITYECDEGYGLETVKSKVGKFPAFDIEVGYRDYDRTPLYFAVEEYWDFKVIGNIYENKESI